MIQDNTTLKGELEITLSKPGEKPKVTTVKNLVMQVGKNFAASRMLDASQAVMGWMASGTGAGGGVTTPSIGQTTLDVELARVPFSTPPTLSGSVITYTAVWNPEPDPNAGTGAIVEAGIFNASSAGTMLSRTSFPVINKAAADTLSIVWRVSVL